MKIAYLNFQNKNLSGGVIVTVVGITVVITLITSGLILISYYKNLILLDQKVKQDLQRNAYSGMNYLLTSNQNQLSETFDLFGYGRDSITVSKKVWGIFSLLQVQARRGKHTHSKIALGGSSLDNYSRSAIYLADENTPLSVTGETSIIGNCYLPSGRIRPSFIEGKLYARTKLIEGAILSSSHELPPLNDTILQELKLLSLTVTGIDPNFKDSVHSFLYPPLKFSYEGNTKLENVTYRGNVIIVGNGHLEIDRTAHLEDVLIFSASVTVREGFEGSLQIIARDSVTIEKNCRLTYPSVVGTISSTKSSIKIYPGSEITGIVLLGQMGHEEKNSELILMKNSKIKGQAYVAGFAHMMGTVEGHITCRKFLLRTGSAVYVNTLVDATINFDTLNKAFTTSELVSSSSCKQIVKWLY